MGREFARIPIITTPDGTNLLLEDIAIIKDGFDESDKFSFYNGKPAVSLTIFRVGQESPISIEESVEEVITELRDTMPEGLEFTIWDSRAEAYRGRMSYCFATACLD